MPDFDRLRADLHWLSREDGVVPPHEAVTVLARVLGPLLASEGLTLFELGERRTKAPPNAPVLSHVALTSVDMGVDLVAGPSVSDAERPRITIGIEYKHHGGGKPIGVEAIRQLVHRVRDWPDARAMLIGRFGFTPAARQEALKREPVAVELLDLGGIGAWINRLETGKPSTSARIQLLIRGISHEFAQLVAHTPDALDNLEWRDLERMMARVMEGLGFRTTLTPESKDGGKDLVLQCEATSGDESYIVELKHWRSGKRVGPASVTGFLHVIVSERRSGGLFLSTSGYAADAFEGLTEVTRQRLRLGDRNKVVLLAQTYIRACQGLWSPPTTLPEVLFDATL